MDSIASRRAYVAVGKGSQFKADIVEWMRLVAEGPIAQSSELARGADQDSDKGKLERTVTGTLVNKIVRGSPKTS